MDDGAPALTNGEVGEALQLTLLRAGDIIRFTSCASYGNATLTLKPGGEWHADREMPREAENVCALNGWQLDSLAPSVDECVEALFEAGAEPDQYELSYYTWSNGIPFLFDAATLSFGPTRFRCHFVLVAPDA
jgi:hypothetical protein